MLFLNWEPFKSEFFDNLNKIQELSAEIIIFHQATLGFHQVG